MKYKNLYIAFILFIISTIVLYKYTAKEKEITKMKKYIIESDVQKKIADGKYSKLVNTYANQKDLNNQLRKENQILYDTIKLKGERILSITNTEITFKGKISKGTPLVKVSDSTFNFTSYYPEKKDYFIKYDGKVNTVSKTVDEKWSFTKFKLDIILTERKDGIWDSYIDAPKFVEVSNIKINSLPPIKYSSPQTRRVNPLNIYGGTGYITDLTKTKGGEIYLQGGVGFKGKIIILGQVTTNKTAGVGLLYKF